MLYLGLILGKTTRALPGTLGDLTVIRREVLHCLVPPQLLLKELNLGPHKYEFSSMAVSLALEGKASHRELTSRLLSDLSGKMLSQGDMARAFDKMLRELPDLLLDTPEAPLVSCSCTSPVMSVVMCPVIAQKLNAWKKA